MTCVVQAHRGYDHGMAISHTLRLFGQSARVAVGVAIMALDAGLIPYGHDVISVGCFGRGAEQL